MSNRPLPRRIRLNNELSPEQVSHAWEFLASLNPLLPEPPPPKELEHLTDADWYLLDSLLCREMKLKEESVLQ